MGRSMQVSSESVELTGSQAVCLQAIRDGLDSKTRIAIRAKLDLGSATVALEALKRLQLVDQFGRYRWRTTRRGKSCPVEVIPDPKQRRGGKASRNLVPGPGAERLLGLLDQPMRGRQLAERLGITRQAVYQAVVKLLAQGKLRVGDEEKILRIVARHDDPTLLLSRDEERVLSAAPDNFPTSASKIRVVSRLSVRRAKAALTNLQAIGFIEDVSGAQDDTLLRLTAAGSAHFQRDVSARRADLPPLKVRSDRVISVLSHIARSGEVRTRDVMDALEISRNSMNALMQYLKRKGLVKKAGQELNDPFALTREGHDILAEMRRRQDA